ncbi:LPS export ABC transporter permease LptF [Desulfonatronovibrio hydrogenovorans]|uniref:LPS export ABC transporter permease LptF n=1 Tax=Desulfonatronovibrio hydrogenovorans TaxID=53245 RepID=UPI00068D78A1|nr:LPS export ABC transporter permease LptF [Desulfonatronovibrio hydrogenovorans]
MKILHRQIIKEVGLIFAVTLSSMLSLIVIGRMIDLKDIFVGQNIAILDVFKAFVFLSPSFLGLVIPIACMLSIFLCFLRMASDRELTALQTSGISIKNLVLSPLIFSFAALVLTFYVSMDLVSKGADNFRAIAVDMIRQQTELSIQPGVFSRHIPGLAIFAQQTDLETGEMRNVFIHDETQADSPMTIVAPRGRIISESRQGEIFFILEKGRIYSLDQPELSVVSFGEYRVRLDLFGLLGDIRLRDKDPEEMSWSELSRAKAESDPQSGQYRLMVLEQHKRFALPVACLVLGFFAVPLGMSLQGIGRNWGLLLAILCFLAYYGLFTTGYSLGEMGRIPVIAALWAPNLIFAGLAMAGFYFFSQGRELNLTEIISKLTTKKNVHHT